VAVVPGATHLFAEPGTLERAADMAADWFRRAFEAARLQPLRPGRPMLQRATDAGEATPRRSAA
jgi:hypothetical protein